MTCVEELNELYALENDLSFETHASGLTLARVNIPECQAECMLHGAHVLSYRPAHRERSILFLSDQAVFAQGKPIRGGIPICFPWFGSHPTDQTLPAHGWARTQAWELIETARTKNQVILRMALAQDELYSICELAFGAELSIDVSVTNGSDIPRTFEIALHTYFEINSITDVEVSGLENVPYVDQLKNEIHPGENTTIRFEEETDRIYQGSVKKITLSERNQKTQFIIEPRGSRSTIVWNPWIEKSKRMADFGDEEYLRMCCIETANVRANQIKLAAGQTHSTGATIRLA
ncbi:MAG: D-hexose-6-phosphate mutarotase [Pirellula sp.]|jgi:D-hexose-6-phosphate mutarotase|nr:D-hexose-6-phosphate mutarotase [Pirellula sp.]